MDLDNPQQLLARSLYIGSDALYVNLDSKILYKINILQDLHDNDFDSLEVTRRSLQEFLPIHLQDGEVFSVHELENTSDVWGAKGLVASDLLVVAYQDNTIEIFDRITADSLKLIQQLPNPFS